MGAARTFSSSFFDWLYPSRCALCSVLGDAPICSICAQDFVTVDHVAVSNDGGPLQLSASLFRYGGRVSQAVRRLKYSRVTSLADPVAAMMADGLDRLGLQHYDLVVPIPIHWSRRCTRGFNQAELLAERLPNLCPRALRRVKRTKPQVHLNREARMYNIEDAFRARTTVAGKSVLLIDDVLTSGQTARECAKALVAAGAVEVAALAFAGEAGW